MMQEGLEVECHDPERGVLLLRLREMATMTMMMMMIMVMMMMMMVVMMIMMMAGRAPSSKYLRCSVVFVVAVLVLLHFVLASKFITLINTFAICPF